MKDQVSIFSPQPYPPVEMLAYKNYLDELQTQT